MRVNRGPTVGTGGTLLATITDGELCASDAYQPSELEGYFKSQSAEFFYEREKICHGLANYTDDWIAQNQGKGAADPRIFSKICRKGSRPQFVEPLAGILREPRFPCKDAYLTASIEWLLLADSGSLRGGKKVFFDAGCSHFTAALKFFLTHYEQRGIVFDEVHAWEVKNQSAALFWAGVPPKMREFWEPRIHWYNAIGVSAAHGAEHNVVEKIHRTCGPTDFCAFKLDIDTPWIELPLVQQLLDNPAQTRASLSEFFFEHHVHGLMQKHGWKSQRVNGTFPDSYNIFTKLREMGVRAHSWI